MKNLFYVDHFPESFNHLENLAHSLGMHDITDIELWDTIREYQTPPHFSNVYIGIVFSYLASEIQERYGIACDYYINSFDSHFYINQEQIYTEGDFYDLLNKQMN